MKFTESYEYEAPVAKVWQMLSDPAFVTSRDENLEIPDPTVETNAQANQIVSTTSGEVPPSMIPAAAQRFLKGGAEFLIREEWRLVDATTIHGALRAEGKGVPAYLQAQVELRQTPAGNTKATMNGEIKVNIPFLGAKLEKQALSFAPKLIAADKKAATDWLAKN